MKNNRREKVDDGVEDWKNKVKLKEKDLRMIWEKTKKILVEDKESYKVNQKK